MHSGSQKRQKPQAFRLKLIVLGLAMLSYLLYSFQEATEAEPSKSSEKSSSTKTRANMSTADFSLSDKSAAELANKINELVTQKFFDKQLVEKEWQPAFQANKEFLSTQSDLLSFSRKINEMLAKFHTSHTQLLTENDETFYFLRSLFGAMNKDQKKLKQNYADFTGLGVGGGSAEFNQVRYVLDDSPAAKAGFKRGDKILNVKGKPYTGYAVWYQSSGSACPVHIEREGKELDLMISPKKMDFLEGYVNATEKSARVINHSGHKIGYIHLWSGGEGSEQALSEPLSNTLLDTESLVLDLRDGYGGTSYAHMDPFFRPGSAFPDMKTTGRKGSHFERAYYDKPIALLINNGVRSGKEINASGFKQSQRARLFGETTAGFVVAGQFLPINSRVILYLAVLDLTLAGKRLEAKGVSPDVFVKDELSPRDAVLEKALEYLSTQKSK